MSKKFGLTPDPLDTDPQAWLFYCWKPGKSAVFASVQEDDTSWWGEGWITVTRLPLVIKGGQVTLCDNGNVIEPKPTEVDRG